MLQSFFLKIFEYKTFFLTLSVVLNAKSCNTIYNNLKTAGFSEIENSQLCRKDYTEIYKEFDNFIQLIGTNSEFFKALNQSEKDFVSDPINAIRYCGAPPSFRDPNIHSKKINNRIYFQYIKEHYQLIQKKYSYLLGKLQSFFNYLEKVDQVSKNHFINVLAALEQDCPGISKIFYGDNKELTVVTKIVRYKKLLDWHEKPHFDKSGLTIILDNDDNHQSLMLCEDTNNPTRAGLTFPARCYAESINSTSALLIGGLCLKTLNYDIKPTLHYVGPIQNEYRHSLISFLLVPGIDTSTMKTEFIES